MISHLFCFIIDMFCTMIVLIALCHWSHKSTLSKTSSLLAIISTVIFISQNQSACIKILFNKYFYYIFIKPCKLQIQFSINKIRINNSEFIQENTKCTKTKLNERQISSTNHHNSHGTYCICFVLFFFSFSAIFSTLEKKTKTYSHVKMLCTLSYHSAWAENVTKKIFQSNLIEIIIEAPGWIE